MNNVLLKEATTQQLINQIIENTKYMVLCVEIPGNDRSFANVFHGEYIEQAGAISSLNSDFKYKNYMLQKQAYNDDPEFFFGDDDED